MKAHKLLALFDSLTDREIRMNHVVVRNRFNSAIYFSVTVLAATAILLEIFMDPTFWRSSLVFGIVVTVLVEAGVLIIIRKDTATLLRNHRETCNKGFDPSKLFIVKRWYGWFTFNVFLVCVPLSFINIILLLKLL